MTGQLDNAIALVTLEDLIARARAKGLMGIAVWQPFQGQYCARTLTNRGAVEGPECYRTATTIEEVLTGLSDAMDLAWGK